MRRALFACAGLALGLALWIASRSSAQRASVAAQAVSEPAPVERASAPLDVATPAAVDQRVAETATPAEVATEEAAATELATLAVLVRSKRSALPIAEARVHAWAPDAPGGGGVHDVDDWRGDARAAPRTGADGRAELELRAGCALSVRVTSEATPAATKVVEVEALAPGERRELTIELDTELAHILCGRVVERGTRAPIGGARVTLGTSPDRLGEARATSDDEGRFRVSYGAWELERSLCIDAPGYGRALLPILEGHEAVEREVEVQVEKSAALDVALLDPAGGAIRDARVTVFARDSELAAAASTASLEFTGRVLWTLATDGAGRVRFDGLPARVALTLAATREREPLTGAPEPLHLEPGETRSIEWRVGAGAAVVVTVTEADGSPGKGVRLSLEHPQFARPYFLNDSASRERRSATTDERGLAHFEDVPAGDWALGPTPVNRRERAKDDPAPLAQFVDVPDLGEVHVELRLERGLAIRGRVVAADGGKPSFAYVTAYEPLQQFVATGVVDAESGVFSVGPLVPGRYELVANGQPFAPSEPAVVEAGAEGVELRLRNGAALEGRVVDAASRLPCSAHLVLSSADPQANVQLSGAREDGRFRFDGLAPGLYDVAAAAADGRFGLARALRVEAGSESKEVELALEAGAKLRVRFEGPTPSTNVELRSGGVLVDVNGVSRGNEVVLTAPPGPASLRLNPPFVAEGVLREVELVAGETLELVYDDGWK